METLIKQAVASPYGVSAIGRPLDPSYPSNRVAVIGAVLVGIGFGLYNLTATETLPSSAFAAAMAVFLAWAVGREIDPDNTRTAGLAMIGTAGFSLFFAPSLLLGAGVLIGTRLASGTVGLRLKPIDRVVVISLAGLLGSGAITLAAVPLLAIGIVINDGRSRLAYATAGIAILAATSVAIVRQPEVAATAPDWASLILLGLVVASAALVPRTRKVVAQTDVGEVGLSGWRIDVSRLGLAATIVLAVALAGNVGFEQSMGTAGAALLGTAIARWSP
jgi:hypothetical protein